MVSLRTNFSIFLQSYTNSARAIKTPQLLLNCNLLSCEYYYYE